MCTVRGIFLWALQQGVENFIPRPLHPTKQSSTDREVLVHLPKVPEVFSQSLSGGFRGISMHMTSHPKDVQQILSLALGHSGENSHREEILALRKAFFPFPSHMQAL